ncbi:MAG: hypothetical protein HS115_06845 [Spirochaetales bacterium]|nr:hypothetical protein [Spirochaetales bacterium]
MEDLIHMYTRQQAIDDGVLIDLTGTEIAKQHFKYPVALTQAVWGLLEDAVESQERTSSVFGILHDIFYMSKVRFEELDETTRIFQVIIAGSHGRKKHTLKAVCGPGDEAEPVITIMLADED